MQMKMPRISNPSNASWMRQSIDPSGNIITQFKLPLRITVSHSESLTSIHSTPFQIAADLVIIRVFLTFLGEFLLLT